MAKHEKSEDTIEKIAELVEDFRSNTEFLDSLKVMTPSVAYKILDEPKEMERLIKSLLSVQDIYGVVLDLSPESVYSAQYKGQTSEIYQEVLNMAKATSNYVDEAFKIWQDIVGDYHPYTQTPRYCFKLFTTIYEGTTWSFHGILLQILSNSRKILSFFEKMPEAEAIKAPLGVLRTRRASQLFREETSEISSNLPPSLEEKIKEKLKKNLGNGSEAEKVVKEGDVDG